MDITDKDKNLKTCWIIGCGDIGKRVATLYKSEERKKANSISALVSSTESVERCQTQGIDAYALDLDSTYSLSDFNFDQTNAYALDLDSTYSLSDFNFDQADVFYFAPPTPTGSKDQRLEIFLQKLGNAHPRRIVLISTTGIYGDSAGEWIDENTPVNPKADRALRRLSTEKVLQTWSKKTGCEYMILRVPGIYAAERLPIERLKKGLPVINAEQAGFTNRIHADDLAQACIAAMGSETSNETINITDGSPSTMTDYFNQVADFAGLPRPPQISLDEAEKTLSVGMLSYMKESRRIRNDKMLKLLKIKLNYPDLKSGLNANE